MDKLTCFSGFAIGEQCVGPFALIVTILAVCTLVMEIVALALVVMLLLSMKKSEQREQAARGRWNELIEKLITSKKKKNNNNIGPAPVESIKGAFV